MLASFFLQIPLLSSLQQAKLSSKQEIVPIPHRKCPKALWVLRRFSSGVRSANSLAQI
jgi:hypothetical protein